MACASPSVSSKWQVSAVTKYTNVGGGTNDRILNFVKQSSETTMLFTYYDNLRQLGVWGSECEWKFLLDGRECPSGPISGRVYCTSAGLLHSLLRPLLSLCGPADSLPRATHRFLSLLSVSLRALQ